MKKLGRFILVAVIGVAACTDRQTPEFAAGLEAAYGRAPTLQEIESHGVGAGDAIERGLTRRIAQLLQGSADSAMIMDVVKDSSKSISKVSDPAVDLLLKRLYVNRILDFEARQLAGSRQRAKTAGIWVTLGISDEAAGANRALVIRPSGTSGRSIVLLHAAAKPEDIALAFRAIYEDRLRLGDYLDKERKITVRSTGSPRSTMLAAYALHIRNLQASAGRTVGDHKLAHAFDVRLGHLRHGVPKTSP